MGENWNFDDDENDDLGGQGDGPAELRKAYNALKRSHKELTKQVADLTEANSTLSSKVRTTSIADLLQAKGVNPKVAKFIPADVEPDEESVTKWLAEYGDVFNATPASDSAKTASDGDASQGADVTPANAGPSQEDLAALAAALGAASGGSAIPAGAASALISDVEGNAQSFEDVLKIMAKHGVTTVDGY